MQGAWGEEAGRGAGEGCLAARKADRKPIPFQVKELDQVQEQGQVPGREIAVPEERLKIMSGVSRGSLHGDPG